MNTELPLLTIEQSINSYKYLLEPNPSFGMDFFADCFDAKDIVLLEDNQTASQGIPLRFGYYALILRLNGETKRTINQHDFLIKPQSLQLINPGAIFSFEDISAVSKTYVLLFNKSFILEQNLSLDLLEPLLSFHRKNQEDALLNMTEFTTAVAIYKQLSNELRNKESDYKTVVKLLINQLLYLLKRKKLNLTVQSNPTRAEQISAEFLSLIEEHYWHKKSIKDYAMMIGVTPKHLSETIKSTLDHTALSYIHIRIIKEIQYLLCFSDMSIKQISLALNFEAPSQMGRLFKHLQGISPKKYRGKNI